MQDNWFAGCDTPDKIKGRYRMLAMEHHPDRGGNTRTMQDINGAYHAILQGLSGGKFYGSDNKERTYTYDREVEQAVIDKLAELIAAKLPKICRILLLGTWVWVEGTQKEDIETREKLKAAGLRWNANRGAWQWHDGGKYRPHRGLSWEGLKRAYDAVEIDENNMPGKGRRKSGRTSSAGAIGGSHA